MTITEAIRDRAKLRCPVCEKAAAPIGTKRGRWRTREYHLARCPACAFAFVTDPDTDFDAIYDASYYRGQGADPLVSYESERDELADSTRGYELRGLVRYAGSVKPLSAGERWLDFGGGLGTFARYLCSQGLNASVYEEGYASTEARSRGVAVLAADELDALAGTFGVVSAIEVLEHVLEPVETLRQIARLLRPGGLFLYTTGNAAPFRDHLDRWSYVIPEIHVSFYEPKTMHVLFDKAGLTPMPPARVHMLRDILRYKILKNLGLQRRSIADRLIPWPVATRLADRRFHVSAMMLAARSGTPDEEQGDGTMRPIPRDA